MPEFFPQAANFSKKIVASPCARPWFVYVETFFPAFIKCWITLSILDFNDLVRARGEQIVRDGARASRRSISKAGRVRLIGFEPPHERVTSKGLKTLLRLTQPLETIGFMVLLYSATEEFFFDWSTLILRQPYCEAPIQDRPFSRSRPSGRVGILPGGDIVPLPVLDNNGAGYFSSAFQVVVPPGAYDAIFALNLQHDGPGTVEARARINYQGSGASGSIESDTVTLEDGVSAGVIASGSIFFPFPFGGTITWELVGTAVPVGLACEYGHMIVMRVPNEYVL
jgi:hypothetical protein